MARLILAQVLKRKGISKRQFAKLAKMDYATVFRYLRQGAKANPTLRTLSAWARALGLNVRDLIKE